MNLASLAFLILSYYLCCLINVITCIKSKYLIKINDENWRDILQGEWMINFFSKASWCPACKEIERPWNAFADWGHLKNKKTKVAQVDVSENPGLSGRFLVTALPTIYHIKDGVFRIYTGPKDKDDFVRFLKQKQWSTIETMPSWCHPDSAQMALISSLFKFSMKAKDFHNHLVDDKGLPSLLSFGLFGSATLVLGCILGFIMVLIIDQFVPSGKSAKQVNVPSSKKGKKSGEANNTKSQQNNVSVKNGIMSSSSKTDSKNGNVPNGSATINEHHRQPKTENVKDKNVSGNGASNGTTKTDKKKD